MTISNLSSVQDRNVERKTLKEQAGALLRSPSSYYKASEDNKKMRAVAITREAADEMPVHSKIGFMQELQASVSLEFDLKDSTPTPMTSNWAINATQQAKQQPDDSNMVLVVGVTLVLFVFCIKAFCRKFTAQVKIGKQDFDETNKTFDSAHDSTTKNTAFKGERKQSLEDELKMTAVATEEEHGHNVREMPLLLSTSDEKVEDSNPQLIFEVASSAIETTEIAQLKDCPSPGSTVASTVFSIDGGTKDDDDYSIGTETTVGDSVKMDLFCTSPLKDQEFEQQLIEEPEPTVTSISSDSSIKKRSMLKKTLDIPTDLEESALLIKDAKAVMGVGMKLAAAVVAVNVLTVLTRRR
jgi:hypothetical protein